MNFFRSGGRPLFEVAFQFFRNLAYFLTAIREVVVSLLESLGEILVVLAMEVGPWLAPFAPAALTFASLLNNYDFPDFAAYAVAGSIELIGLSAGSTLLKTEIHHIRFRGKTKQVPAWPARVAAAWYFLTVLALVTLTSVGTRFFADNETVFGLIGVGVETVVAFLNVPAILVIGFRAAYREFFRASIFEEVHGSSTEVPGSSLPVIRFRNLPPDVLALLPTLESSFEGARVVVAKLKELGFSTTEKSALEFIRKAKGEA